MPMPHLMRKYVVGFCPEETGGVLSNTGPLEAHGIYSAENVAGDNVLTVKNGDPDDLIQRDVTFSDNLLICPLMSTTPTM